LPDEHWASADVDDGKRSRGAGTSGKQARRGRYAGNASRTSGTRTTAIRGRSTRRAQVSVDQKIGHAPGELALRLENVPILMQFECIVLSHGIFVTQCVPHR